MKKDVFTVSREQFLAQKRLKESINSIPKKNKAKFYTDLLDLIELAHGDNYEDYSI